MNLQRVSPSRLGFGNWSAVRSRSGLHPKSTLRCALLLTSLLLLVSLYSLNSKGLLAAPLAPTDITTVAQAIQQVDEASQGKVTISVHPTLGTVRMVQIAAGGDLLPSYAIALEESAEGQPVPLAAQTLVAKSDAFFAQSGALFGLDSTTTDLSVTASSRDSYGYTMIAYQEAYRGVPIFGGILRSHFNNSGQLTAVNGVAIPTINLDSSKFNTVPTLSAQEAIDHAIAAVRQAVAEESPAVASAATATLTAALTADSATLYLYQAGLVQGVTGPLKLTYQVTVINETQTVRRFVFVDAHSGLIVDQFSGVYELEREVAEGNLGNVVWDEGQGNPEPIPSGWSGGNSSQVKAWNDEITGAKEAYNLFGSLTNGARLSYNGSNATMRTVNNDPSISCPNANWNGDSANYCDGVTADDIVVHEWAHAYTEYTSGLLYAWQPGALNESFSDVWGETADLINGRGTDIQPLRTTNSCSTYSGVGGGDNSTRWLVGEDAPNFGGAIRDMWNPGCYDNPGKVSDNNYHCETDDFGGVHLNSGVPNHLYALLVDGGTYNGRTISGLGLTRAAHLFWRTQTTYLTAISDFADLADGLTAACTDLIGQNLFSLSTGGPGTWGTIAPEKISSTDCSTLATAIAAVELRTPPTQCNFQPLLQPNPPALCSSPQQAVTINLQSWEGGLGQWSVGSAQVAAPGQFSIPNWSVVGSLPDNRTGKAAFAPDPFDNGDQCKQIDESGLIYLQSPPITLPSYATALHIAFDHWMASEVGYDGGLVRYRVNGGAWQQIPQQRFVFNPYNDSLNVSAQGNTNPLAGMNAFTGADAGSTQGSWGQSQIDLSGLIAPGNVLELRFDFGLDGCNGLLGWYVDDVRTYTCANPNDLAVRQEVNATAMLPGQPVTLQLYIDNSGQVPTTNVTVADTLPAALTFVSTDQQGPLTFVQVTGAPNLTWHLDQIIGQLTGTLLVNVKVNRDLNQDQSIVNHATVTADNDGSANNNSANGTINVVVPRLGFAETNDQVEEGNDATLVITVDRVNPYADIVVGYSMSAQSAQAGSDYNGTSGEVTLRSGMTSTEITIPIIDDSARESDETFRVTLSTPRGAQLTTTSATVTIVDDDHPGLDISPLIGSTTESGGEAHFGIALKTEPTAAVTVVGNSSDPGEGASVDTLTFTPANWQTKQQLTVKGVDDPVDDGAQPYTVALQVTSNDGEYAALAPVNLALVNEDNDIAALTLGVVIAKPGPSIGKVLTYTYTVTNSGTVNISQLSAEDTLFGTLLLTPTTLLPGTSSSIVVTRTTVEGDLVGAVKQTTTVSGISVGGNLISTAIDSVVTLLDVGLRLKSSLAIAGLADPCQGAETMRVPVGTKIIHCIQATNTGSLTLTPHTVSDSHLGTLMQQVDHPLTAGESFAFTYTETINSASVNSASNGDAASAATTLGANTIEWIATVVYTPPVGEPPLGNALTLQRSTQMTVTTSATADDQDADTIPDNVEGAGDVDGDKLPNYLDTDSDGDGLLDQVEVGDNPSQPRDRDGDGIPDYLQAGPGIFELLLPVIRR